MIRSTQFTIPDELICAAIGARQRAAGLMHLLAVAYNAKDDSEGPPSKEEAGGIIWLARRTGEELAEAFDALLDFRTAQETPSPNPKEGEES